MLEVGVTDKEAICGIRHDTPDSRHHLLVSQADIGQRMRQARERIGMSQKEFADSVDKDQTAISEYETGKRKVPAVELSVFARVLGVPVSFFYDGDFQVDAADQLILQEFHELPTPEARTAALQFIRIFADTLKQHLSQK
jgi:transcriptional regulator with XRE-family HTH domain